MVGTVIGTGNLEITNHKHETENKQVELYTLNAHIEGHAPWKAAPPKPPPNNTTNWRPSDQMPEPLSDTSHSNHYSTYGTFTEVN